MATNPITGTAKTGSPAGVVSDPRSAPAVSPGQQSSARALRRAITTTTPKLGRSLSQDVETYRKGPPQELLSQRQYFREELGRAEEEYYGIEPFKPDEFGGKRPEFDRKAVTRVMPMLMVMTALGGRQTKINALGMMKALDSGIKGLQAGNEKAYKQALFDYQQNYKEFQNRETVRRSQYDLLREAKKDGLQLALQRKADADKAVDDYNAEAASNINLQATLAKNARDLEEHNVEMQIKKRKLLAPAEEGIEYPKSAYQQIDAKSQKELDQAVGLFNTFREGAETATRLGAKESMQEAIGRTFFPVLMQMGVLAQYDSTKNIKTQEQMIDALDNAKVQQIVADLIRRNAGLSQTAKEIENVRNYVGTNKIMQADAFYRLQSAIAKDMEFFSRRSRAHAAAFTDVFQVPTAVGLRTESERLAADYRKSLGGKPAPKIKSFRTEAEAAAAQSAGKIRPGEVILIGGVEYEVTE